MLRPILSALLFFGCAVGTDTTQAQYNHCDHLPVIVYSHPPHFHRAPIYLDSHTHGFHHPVMVPYGIDPRMSAMNCIGDQCIPNPAFTSQNQPLQQGGQGLQFPDNGANQLNQVPTVIPNPSSDTTTPNNAPALPTFSNQQQSALPNFTGPQQNAAEAQSPALNPAQNNSTSSASGVGMAKILQDDSPLMSGGEQLGSIDRGQELKVMNIQGNWVQLETTWLKANAWIRKDLVDLGNVAMPANTDVAPLAN